MLPETGTRACSLISGDLLPGKPRQTRANPGTPSAEVFGQAETGSEPVRAVKKPGWVPGGRDTTN
jgi:hypothetical protein